LELGDGGEPTVVGHELPAQGLVEPLHFPRRGRRGRGGEAVHDPVVSTYPIEQHLPAVAEAGGELLAIVSEDLVGHPEAAQRHGEGQAHRPARGPQGG
jgi:hypothetical protein